MALKDLKIEANKLTAKAELQTPMGSFPIAYDLAIDGETMKGKGELDFGGQSFALDMNLKRTSDSTTAAAAAPAAAPAGGQQGGARTQGTDPATGQARQQARDVPQPQQTPSIDYLVGQWNIKWMGRESPLGPGGSLQGVATFKKTSPTTLEAVTEFKSEEGSLRETANITWDEAQKSFAFKQRRSNGVQIESKADWSRPIAMLFTVQPIKVKGQTLQLKRNVSVISAYSFSITEELSEDGGPFVRLGSGVYSKVGAPPPTSK
jgi:hypothetical protein